MKTKSVEWSYPTSPNAERFKFRLGCWVVKIHEDDSFPVSINGFAGIADAVDYAKRLSFPWQDPTRLIAVPAAGLPSDNPPQGSNAARAITPLRKTSLPCGCEHVGILAACPIHEPASEPCASLAEHNAYPGGRWGA